MGLLAVVSNPGRKRRRRRPLARRVVAIEYQHAKDGKHYRHDFRPGVRMDVGRDGVVRVRGAKGGPAAREVGGQLFLVNPRKGATVAKRKPPGRFTSWSAWSKNMQQKRKRAGGGTPKRKRKKTASRKRAAAPRKKRRNPAPAKRRRAQGAGEVKRKRRAPARRRTSAARRRSPRRRYRRNPTVMRTLTDSGVAVLQMLIGKIIARSVPQLIPGIPKAGAMGIGVQFVVALVIGALGSRMLGARFAENLVRGALLAPIESGIVSLGLPVISPALAGNGTLGSYSRRGNMGSYVQDQRLRARQLNAYVNAQGTADFSQQY